LLVNSEPATTVEANKTRHKGGISVKWQRAIAVFCVCI